MINKRITEKRMKSALLGCALGDAWGYKFEFKQGEKGNEISLVRSVSNGDNFDKQLYSFGEKTMMVLDGSHELEKYDRTAAISDDTQMTLASMKACQEILEKYDSINDSEMDGIFLDEFINYSYDADNTRAPGFSVTSSLQRQARNKFYGELNRAVESNGCGSVMRFSPTAILMPTDYSICFTCKQAMLTHRSEASYATAVLLSAIVRNSRIHDSYSVNDESIIDICLEIANGYGTEYYDKGTIDPDKFIRNSLCTTRSTLGKTVNLVMLLEMAKHFKDEIVDRVKMGEISEILNDEYYIDHIGEGWDSVSCTAASIMLVDVFRELVLEGIDETLATYVVMNCAVGWKGDRDSRGAVVGALMGAIYPDNAQFQKIIDMFSIVFEDRYNSPIKKCYWDGFDKVRKEDVALTGNSCYDSSFWKQSEPEKEDGKVILTEPIEYDDD